MDQTNHNINKKKVKIPNVGDLIVDNISDTIYYVLKRKRFQNKNKAGESFPFYYFTFLRPGHGCQYPSYPLDDIKTFIDANIWKIYYK